MRVLVFAFLVLVATMTTTTEQAQTAVKQPNSAQSPEVQSLNSERSIDQKLNEELEEGRSFWKGLYSKFAVGAVLLGGACALASWTFDRVASGIEDRQKPLISRMSEIDQRIIAIAREETAKAQSDAGTANRLSGETAKKNIELQASLDKEIEDSKERAEELRQKNLETEGRLTDANKKLGDEEATRLELEASLAPRFLTFKEYEDKTTNVDDLRKFKEVSVTLEYMQDAESIRTASVLEYIFHFAGWKIKSATPSLKFLNDGVTVFGCEHHGPLTSEEFARDPNKLCETVVAWLQANEWKANSGPPIDAEQVHPNEIIVQVGFKPNPYFDDPSTKTNKKKADEILFRVDHFLVPNANPKNKKVIYETGYARGQGLSISVRPTQ